MRRVIFYLFIYLFIYYYYYFAARGGGGGGGGGGVLPDFSFSFFPCSADHERDWPPCKVVFFGLATNALNVRNNNNNNNRPGDRADQAHRARLIARSITFLGCLLLVKSVFGLVCFPNKLCFKVVIYYLCTRVTAVCCLY